MERRRALNLTDTRAVLATSGDVAIGAYARRVRRKRAGIAALGVLLILGAGATYWALREPADRATLGTYRVLLRCATCGYQAGMEVATSQAFPLACPACKERACRPVWQCRKCGREFVADQREVPTVCPNVDCRSAEVGGARAP
jgi:hypothetical protein